MERKKYLLAGVAGLTLALTGCVSHYRDGGADYLKRPDNVTRAPYYTDFQIAQDKVTGQGKASVLFWLFQFSDGKYCQLGSGPDLSIFSQIAEVFSPTRRAIFNAKSSAMYQACESASADQILGATFEYRITDYFFFSTVECTAKGYPATAKGVKLLDKQPVILNSWQKVEYLKPHEIPLVYSGPEHATPPSAVVDSSSGLKKGNSALPW